MIIIYTTFPNKKLAERIVKQILKCRLAACINIWSIKTQYLWHGRIEKAKEWALMIKTFKKNYQKIEKIIKDNHPYKIPAIFSWPITRGEKNYLKWLKKEIR